MLKVSPENEGQRIDVVASAFFSEIPSRSVAAKMMALGHITLNGKKVKPSHRIKSNDIIGFDSSALATPTPPPFHTSNSTIKDTPISEFLNIVFEDEHILVINKPSGLVCHPGAGVQSGTLSQLVFQYCGHTLPSLGGAERAGLVHRLDKDTSGIMVVAKSQLALSTLSQDFAQHRHKRLYKALTLTHPQQGLPRRIETGHGRHPTQRVKFSVKPLGEGKRAVTETCLLKTYGNGQFAQLLCALETGRTHQIRVQLAHFGFGLLGDGLYNATPFGKQPHLQKILKPIAQRHMLHAHTLGFCHPQSGQYLEFYQEPPDDFLKLELLLTSLI